MRSYHCLLQNILDYGEDHSDRTGVGTLSVFGEQWRHYMPTGFPLLTTKRVPLRWVAEELFWFLSGSTNEKDLQARGVDIWTEWSSAEQCAKFGREEGDLGPIYGQLWRSFPVGTSSVDQIAKILDQIMETPNSRRIIVSGWHPQCCDEVALPPCHTLWQIKVHQTGELSLHLYQRSCDAFLGLPFNIASYALLLKMIAHVTGKGVRDLVISFGDLHLYRNHIEQAKLQLSRKPFRLPQVHINSQLTGDPLVDLLTIGWDDIELVDYQHHSAIKADVAV